MLPVRSGGVAASCLLSAASAPYTAAMVKLSGVPPRGVVLGFKGQLDFYSWKGIPVVRRWPRPKRTPPTPQEKAQWPDFKTITQGYKTMDVTVVAALSSMASGTQLTTKDVAVQLYYGNALTEENYTPPA